MSTQQRIELSEWHGNIFGSTSCLPPAQHMHFVHGGLLQRERRHLWGLQSFVLQVCVGSVFLPLRAGSSVHIPSTEIVMKYFSALI